MEDGNDYWWTTKKIHEEKGIRDRGGPDRQNIRSEYFTIVWARRLPVTNGQISYPDLERFNKLTSDTKYPVQFIWAGKPYPMDYSSDQ